MKVLLVPLDDRPCCTRFVQRVGEMAGAEVSISPSAGNFLEPGDPQGALDFLASQLPHSDGALVSLDMIAWGGLVASRSQGGPFQTAKERIVEAGRLSMNRPVHAFQSIMRTAPTQTSPEEVELAERLVELSVRSARGEATESLEATFPPGYLDEYGRRRWQALQLNRLAIQLTPYCFQSLLLGIDDSRTEGWNLLEIKSLEPWLRREVTVAPGTDEMALLQLVRLVGARSSVAVRFWPPDSERVVGRYEDRSMREVFLAQCEAAGVSSGDDRVLWVYGPRGVQREASQQQGEGDPEGFLRLVEESLQAGRAVAVADVAYANGGDRRLLEGLIGSGLAGRLVAYSAWNTAGNTLGTALAALALWPDQPRPPQDLARRRFLAERLLDDGFYQGEVRREVGQRLGAAGLRMSPEQAASVGEEVRARLGERLASIEPGATLHCSLPWGRLFEVDLDVRLG